jgi:hypothetical protein
MSSRKLTESQIELRIERMVDHLDRVFLNGDISQSVYDAGMNDLRIWEDEQYRLLNNEEGETK